MDYADGGDLYTKIANQKKIGKGNSNQPYTLFSMLLRRLNPWLVCTDGSCYQTYSRSQNSAQRFEDIKYFHDLKWTG